MRIIAGSAKGRKIKILPGKTTRPTLDRIREAMFSIINPYVRESKFLDLFGGTGSITLEALSRGAKKAVIIEKDREALENIIKNVNKLNFENKCRAYKNDAFRGIEILDKKREKFDIIFLDPPYKCKLISKLIIKLSEFDLLENDGIIVSEHDYREEIDNIIGKYMKIDERKYGKIVLSFFQKNTYMEE